MLYLGNVFLRYVLIYNLEVSFNLGLGLGLGSILTNMATLSRVKPLPLV